MISRHRVAMSVFVRVRRSALAVAALVLGAVGPCLADDDPFRPFAYVDIGCPPGMVAQGGPSDLAVTDINIDGAIVGYFPKSSTEHAGFYWYEGEWQTFDLDPNTTQITGINDYHQLTGWKGTASDQTALVITDADDDGVFESNEITEVADSQAVDIANSGCVIGNHETTGAGFVTSSTQYDLDDLAPGRGTKVTDIGGGPNDHIIGFADADAGDWRPVVWLVSTAGVPGNAQELPNSLNLNHSNDSGAATAVNDGTTTTTEPHIVGYLIDDGVQTGRLWRPDGSGGWTDPSDSLSQMTTPFDINNSNEIVGHGPGGMWDPRLWTDTLTGPKDALDLTQLVYPLPAFVANFEVTAINDNGVIAGTAQITGGVLPTTVHMLVPYNVTMMMIRITGRSWQGLTTT